MSSVLWLVIFIYEENSTDYYHNPLDSQSIIKNKNNEIDGIFGGILKKLLVATDLINFLTSENDVLPFHSLESFVEDGTYQLIPSRGTAFFDKFANSKDPVAEKISKLMLTDEKLSVTKTFKKVR
ncbi:hypothetical protein HZH66_013653 [Vespula vulgaris]|uniref:Uncharacterized protein n=1 Tax=Vespula vulgaris TaxID=7454 RepID=A0A834J5B2_VESVU|nr:hypothetical protein HZH66_013653 [Vespula vulgaris]